MPRRHGRMFLRGKPGLFILTSVICLGIFLAYYTFGRSSPKPSKYNMYKSISGQGKFSNFRSHNDNKGFSDMVFKKHKQMNQLPKPVLPQPDWVARRNFGGLKKEDQFRPGSEEHVDDEYTFQENVVKTAVPTKSTKYAKPDEVFSPLFSSVKLIVHLDLKGAHPKMDYLKQVLPLFAKLGATGVLIEYEDTFPYSRELSMLAAENAYTKDDISQLLALCKENRLEVIPLVQTFGHMEFVLKHSKYQHLRENFKTPQVISPAHNESYSLISSMIDQILSAHPNVQYLHIGSDEVYDLGMGQAHDMIARGMTKDEIILQHIVRVAKIVQSKRQIGVIIWDDELRKVSEKLIEKSGLNRLVEPMVWSYIPEAQKKLPEDIWAVYGRLFSGIWAASSFKGSTGSAQFYTNVSRHLENHLSWVRIIKKMKDEMSITKFRGIALTGWQRYDHYATLCELLPEALPSLAVCLQTIRSGGFSLAIHKTASEVLKCSALIELGVPKLNPDNTAQVSQDCAFPGSAFYYGTQQLWGLVNKYRRDEGLQSYIQGWLTDFHIRHRFGSPGQLKILLIKLERIISGLKSLINPMTTTLNTMYDNYTTTEWVEVNLLQRINRLDEKSQKAKLLIQQTTWPRRPLHEPLQTSVVQMAAGNQPDQFDKSSRYDVKTKQEGQFAGGRNDYVNKQRFPGPTVNVPKQRQYDYGNSKNIAPYERKQNLENRGNFPQGGNRHSPMNDRFRSQNVLNDSQKHLPVGTGNKNGFGRMTGNEIQGGFGRNLENQSKAGLARFPGRQNKDGLGKVPGGQNQGGLGNFSGGQNQGRREKLPGDQNQGGRQKLQGGQNQDRLRRVRGEENQGDFGRFQGGQNLGVLGKLQGAQGQEGFGRFQGAQGQEGFGRLQGAQGQEGFGRLSGRQNQDAFGRQDKGGIDRSKGNYQARRKDGFGQHTRTVNEDGFRKTVVGEEEKLPKGLKQGINTLAGNK